jgi:uroporphyrinogen-III decarboxylase
MCSRERILATVRHQPVDHLPLCFDGIGHQGVEFLSRRYPDQFELARFYLDLGLDTGVRTAPPYHSRKGFETKQWTEHPADAECPLIFKEYATPRGTLRQVVRKPGYPFGSVPLFEDHHVPPGRSRQYCVEREEDLDALECILRPPTSEELGEYREQMKAARRYCKDNGILLSGYALGIGDPLFWLSGIEPILVAALEDPAFLKRYVDILTRWSLAISTIQIEAGVEVLVRRGWYESADFWSPALYREFLYGPLKMEIEMAHQAGVVVNYCMNSGTMPLLDMFRELGFDIYSLIDPTAGDTDLVSIKREVGDAIALYGGVSNHHVLERGTPEQVREAVAAAIEVLAPGGGFILGLGDVLDYTMSNPGIAERNFYEMIESWKEMRQGLA